MSAWRRPTEVVHTTTFAGAPLPAATALATLDVITREKLGERAARVGGELKSGLERSFAALPSVRVRGRGLMLAVEIEGSGATARAARLLLESGYIVTTGGTDREALVLTPPLNIAEHLLEAVVPAVVGAVTKAIA
jgi:4-aminobutyrate aminotransferase-like enzyme